MNESPDALPRRPLVVTPESREINPALAAAEIFAGDTLFDEVMKEIKKERARQKRRERAEAVK